MSCQYIIQKCGLFPTLSRILFSSSHLSSPYSSILSINCLNLFLSLTSLIHHPPLTCNCPSLTASICSMISLTIGLLSAYISPLFPLSIPLLSHSLHPFSPEPFFLSLSVSASLALSIPFIRCRLILKSSPPVLCLKLSFIHGAKSASPF